jgi:ABC-2 type transport system permease protein
MGAVQRVLGRHIVARRLSEAGIDTNRALELIAPPEMKLTRYRPEQVTAEDELLGALLTSIAFTVLLYMTILLYGQGAGRSVLKEKQSKTVEILLSSVSSTQLLGGKLLGKAGAALLQYGVWIGMAAAFVSIAGPALPVELGLAGGAATYGYLVGFFMLAFLLYSGLYAAVGAVSTDEQQLQQAAWPVLVFLMLPMVLVGLISASPDGTVARVLSLVPFTAPIVMFQRLLLGAPAAWEVLLSVGLLLASIAAVAWGAARVFRVGILMTGKRFSLREALRWARYPG